MGSEQSMPNQGGQQGRRSAGPSHPVRASSASRAIHLRQTKSSGGRGSTQIDDYDDSSGSCPGNTSPGPSICSDSDLPYISYTVNRPIGGKSI